MNQPTQVFPTGIELNIGIVAHPKGKAVSIAAGGNSGGIVPSPALPSTVPAAATVSWGHVVTDIHATSAQLLQLIMHDKWEGYDLIQVERPSASFGTSSGDLINAKLIRVLERDALPGLLHLFYRTSSLDLPDLTQSSSGNSPLEDGLSNLPQYMTCFLIKERDPECPIATATWSVAFPWAYPSPFPSLSKELYRQLPQDQLKRRVQQLKMEEEFELRRVKKRFADVRFVLHAWASSEASSPLADAMDSTMMF